MKQSRDYPVGIARFSHDLSSRVNIASCRLVTRCSRSAVTMGSAASKPAPSATRDIDEKACYPQLPPVARQPLDVADDQGDAPDAGLTADKLAKWADNFDKSPSLQLSRLVLSKSDPVAPLASRTALIKDGKVFNTQLKGLDAKGEYPGPRTNQLSSGRCWLFATTNVLRYQIMRNLKLSEFQLSQSYLFFYDKLEKANYYLENVLELADTEDLDGRLMSFLNSAPVNDGGQWDMAVNLVEKYGVIPQTLFPESYSSSASGKLNSLLTSKLREFALELRELVQKKNVSEVTVRRRKDAMMADVYNTLSICLGTPPTVGDKFTWEYYDKDGKFASWEGTTNEFFEKFASTPKTQPKDSFSLINDPRNKYETLYTVERLGNIWGGRPVQYVNAPAQALEEAVITCIKADHPVFFGCDVGKALVSAQGVMDRDVYDTQLAFGYKLGMNKAQRLQMGESSMTHAMVITAVHIDKVGRAVKYKVENSWGKDAGEQGWFMATADWFNEYVYQIVVPKSLALAKYVKVLEKGEPVILKPWDPMGTLA